MKRQTILVPLDGSVFSQQIIPHIQRLFDPQTHTLILFRVAEMPMGITSVPVQMSGSFPLPTYVTARDFERARHPIYAEQEEQGLRTTLERELRAATSTLQKAGYHVTVVVRFGDPAGEIAHYVKTNHIHAIAMATHGRTGIRQFVLGSVAEQVLRSVDVPVLLVRPHDVPNSSAEDVCFRKY
ncbi:MAG TPA: universal stress protein [Roseiflexaceae bacterium]|nr:universal stress protein [Roseiflexaceae bacterium]